MKVVIVGASGNAGTALLRALAEDGLADEVVAVARRTPRTTPPPPYDLATWRSIDIASRDAAATGAALVETMRGADAVVHLAWALQPNHDRELLRRTNVGGTARVLEAAVTAGVGHVVVASSSGAYAPSHDDDLHGEDWPTTGVPSCEYSVDKADNERFFDAFEREHPEMVLTRLRPALIFQRDAGAEITRFHVGPVFPAPLLKGRVPVLPWPGGLRLQAVHADDVGRAYVAALRHAPGGAINVAAEGVLGPREVASVMSGGRYVEVPMPAVCAAVSAGWNARVLPTSPGWIDMGGTAPLMSTARAADVLGWAPRVSALDALREMVAGMAAGAGTSSPPLRPRRVPPPTREATPDRVLAS